MEHGLTEEEFSTGLSADFQALFEVSPTPFLVVVPPNWTIVAANEARLRVTSTTRDQQIGRRLFDVFPEDPEDPSADGVRNLTASLERVVATKVTDTMAVQRYPVRGPDGRFVERWWAPVNTPVLDKDGDVALILHHVEDVTEVVRLRGDAEGQVKLARGQQAVIDRLRASEAALRESEEFNRRVLESSADCIKVLRLDGRLERMSEGGQRALGITDMAAYLDAVWAESFEPDWRAAAHAAVEAAANGQTGRFEGSLTTAKGELRWWDSVLTPISGKDGRAERVLAVSRDITDLRVTRERMHESETRFRNMADNAPVMMWVTDPSGFCTYLNARWYEFTGQAPAAGEGYGWLDAVHPDDRPIAKDAFVSANAERRDYRVDFRLRRADGVYRWTIDTAAARFSPDGEFLGYVGSVIDIDERREAEELLAFSEEQLRLATEVGEIGQWDVDHLTGAMFWPPRVKAMFGISPDQPVTLDDFYNGVHPDDREKTRAAYEAASDPDRRPLYDVEYRTIGKQDGVVRWVAAKGRGIFDTAGRCVRVIGTAIDVTARKADEMRLRELNERLEQKVAEKTAERNRVWEMSRDLFAVMGFDGHLKAINPAWETTLGRDAATLLSLPFPEQVHPDDHDAVRAVMEVLLRGESVARFEDRLRHADGTWRWISWALVPEGDVFYAVGRDVTAEKEAAAELVAAQEALRQSQKMEAVGQLTGGLAHDFNNLLAGISGSLELMQTRMQQGRLTDVDRYMTAAQGAAKRAAALTHRLLAFSRRQTLDPKPTDVNRLATGMQELIQRTVGPAIPIEVIGAAGIWPALVDPPQLENALLNLCINARDAIPDGGRITIETANKWLDERAARQHDMPEGQYLALSVTDTGTGMPPEVIARVFEPFFTTKPIGEGTGLGLSMIYGFAQQSGGQVRIYSEVGQGTTVCIYLPRHYGEVADDDGMIPITDLPRSEQGETVLIVDDEPTVRMLVTDILEDLGYTAIEAGDSVAGLKVLQSDVRIDLLVTDVGLPGGMNGRQMADAARATRPDLRVLFITGYAENAILGNGQLAPGMAVLTKPFAIETMAARIRSMIEAGGRFNSGVRSKPSV